MKIKKDSRAVNFPIRRTVRLSQEMLDALNAKALETRIDATNLVRLAIAEMLRKDAKTIRKIYDKYD